MIATRDELIAAGYRDEMLRGEYALAASTRDIRPEYLAALRAEYERRFPGVLANIEASHQEARAACPVCRTPLEDGPGGYYHRKDCERRAALARGDQAAADRASYVGD